jgi:Mo-dependent nitrogenase C-terminus
MKSQQANQKIALEGWVWLSPGAHSTNAMPAPQPANQKVKFAPLRPLRNYLDQIQVQSSGFAHRLCQAIPAQCPFERDIKLFGKTLIHIPPMCKLNPFYEELVALRFRALCYLADECGEDISLYC